MRVTPHLAIFLCAVLWLLGCDDGGGGTDGPGGGTVGGRDSGLPPGTGGGSVGGGGMPGGGSPGSGGGSGGVPGGAGGATGGPSMRFDAAVGGGPVDAGVGPGPGPEVDAALPPPPPPGPFASCAEIPSTECFGNTECPADQRCANVGTDLEPVACCIPGVRGDRGAGEPCGDDGEANCASAVCIEQGGEARCSATCDDAGDCPVGLRLCGAIAFSGSEANWCLPDGSAQCRAPQPGDVLIDEILIDAPTPERDNEFFELVNTRDEPVALAGLVVRSNRGEGFVRRAGFDAGCLAAFGRVAVYEDVNAWIWNPAAVGAVEGSTQAFGFANDNPFDFVLETVDGVEIDRASGAGGLASEGVSVTRNPTATVGAPFVAHDAVGFEGTSPGRAP